MSSLADRLRDVIRPSAPSAPVHTLGANDSDVAEMLGGEWHESQGQRYLVIERKYSPGYRHGRVAVADHLPPSDGIWPRVSLLLTEPYGVCLDRSRSLLFLDLETTGLAGGAGSYAFLIGCAWFDGAVLRVRQFFLSSFAAERALLAALTDLAAASGAIVTYNGKTFDLPLIETRLTLHRMKTPFADLQHIDMLHPARRMWRQDDEDGAGGMSSSCRLSTLEQAVCGHVRDGDVPGFEIPSRYFHYVRSGDVRPLGAVLEHNRLDLVSLALVTGYAAQLLDEGAAGTRTAREALGLGKLYERGGLQRDAKECFARAAGLGSQVQAGFADADVDVRAEALRSYAVLCRRERSYAEAAIAWQRILELKGCPPAISRDATDALAVHNEHRVRDLLSAKTFALRSLELPNSAARTQAVHHRLARLNRKLAAPQVAALF